MNETTLNIVCALVAEACAVNPVDVDPGDRLRSYGLDSVRAIELAVMLEDAFGMPIHLQALESLGQATVRDLAVFVDSLRATAA